MLDYEFQKEASQINFWWNERESLRDRLYEEMALKIRRVSRWEWETEAEREFLQKKSHQPKKVKSPGDPSYSTRAQELFRNDMKRR